MTPLQWLHNIKKKTPFLMQKSRFFPHSRFFEVHGVHGLSPRKKKRYARSRTTERFVTWKLVFWNVGLKIRRNMPTCFFVGPDTSARSFWTPFFGWKKCQPCTAGYLKRLTNGQKEGFWPSSAFYRFSFAKSSV